MAGGSGTGVETVGREVVLERGGGAGLVTREWTKNSVTFERLGRWHDREGKRRGEGGGGPAVGLPRSAGAIVGPGPARAVTRTWPTRVARRCSDSGTLALTGGPRWQ
jgi:hypothetical protein